MKHISTMLHLLILIVLAFTPGVLMADDEAVTKPPTTPVQLIQNIKYAVKNGLFRDDAIILNDEKLWELFGGSQVRRVYPLSPSSKGFFEQTIFPPLIDHPASETNIAPYERFSISSQITDASIRVLAQGRYGLNLSSADIEKIFGAGTNAPAPRHPQPQHASDDYIQHRDVEYQLEAPPTQKASATVSYGHDGKVLSITIYAKETAP